MFDVDRQEVGVKLDGGLTQSCGLDLPRENLRRN